MLGTAGVSLGLVQSVLAPVMGLSSINLAYSPGAKRIDVLARSVSVASYILAVFSRVFRFAVGTLAL